MTTYYLLMPDPLLNKENKYNKYLKMKQNLFLAFFYNYKMFLAKFHIVKPTIQKHCSIFTSVCSWQNSKKSNIVFYKNSCTRNFFL